MTRPRRGSARGGGPAADARPMGSHKVHPALVGHNPLEPRCGKMGSGRPPVSVTDKQGHPVPDDADKCELPVLHTPLLAARPMAAALSPPRYGVCYTAPSSAAAMIPPAACWAPAN